MGAMSSLTSQLEVLLAQAAQTDAPEPSEIPTALELAETMTWSPAPWFKRANAEPERRAVVLRPWAWRAAQEDEVPELQSFERAA